MKVQTLLTLFENVVASFADFLLRIHYHSQLFKMVNRFSSLLVNDSGLRLNAFFPKIIRKIFCV